MKRNLFIIVAFIFFSSTMALSQSWEFFPDGTYDDKITSPQDFLGYDLGERFTYHHSMLAYFEKLAEESNRIEFHTYGYSYERRPLTYLIISSPENFENLESIRENNLKLTDPRKTDDEEAENIIKTNPSIAWIGYNVHGNEASGAEAALLAAYQLAAGTDEITEALLRDLVIIIDPVLNPDGREYYSLNYNRALDKRPGSLPIASEHRAVRGGRTNHYNVDLNRDWAFITQIETRDRLKLYKQWMPQVAADIHEMGPNSSYFFFPAASPVNLNFPEQVKKWQRIYGQGNARAFDKYGWQYFTGEIFDMYYPGYGDSWPSLNGATGMTYEQGGGGFAGVALKRGENDILTLRDRLWHHFTASIATLKVSSDNREARLRDFYDFFKTAVEEGRNGAMKEVIFPPPRNPLTFNIMLETLRQHGVEVQKVAESFKAKKVHGYFDEEEQDKNFPEGSYIIRMDQPQKRMAKILFEQDQAIPDTFFYDLSSWAYPYSSNIETYWSETRSNVRTTPVNGSHIVQGRVEENKASYAYLLPLSGIESTLATYELIRAGVKGGIANRDFTNNGRKYKRGTSVFYVINNNNTDVHGLVSETADKYGLTFYGAESGISENGIDLGSMRISNFVLPKIGIVGATGYLRHLFDHRYDIEFISINEEQLGGLDIDDINVLIVTGNLSSTMKNENTKNRFKQWLRDGGVYVGWSGGTSFALSKDGGLANFKLAKAPKKDKKEEEKEDEKLKRLTVEEREQYRKKSSSPGYFARVHLDTTHPLAYGMAKEIAVLKFGTTAFELSKQGGIIGILDKNPRLSGYVYKDNQDKIADKGYLAHKKMGRGHVILFSDNPVFREFTIGLDPLLLNAVLLMPSQR